MWHVLPQVLLLLTFAAVSVSAERRRTGFILAGFSAFYLGLIPLNGLMDSISPPLYALFYAVIDGLAARLLWMYGSKGWKPQAFLLCAFSTTHLLAWAYASGLPSPIDPHQYIVITITLAMLQIIVAFPGIRDGVSEGMGMVQEALARRSLSPARVSDLSGSRNTSALSDSNGSGSGTEYPGRSGVRGVFQVRKPSGKSL